VKLRLHSLRKHRTWLAVLLLPALLFRAFIPVGFMPVVESGGLTIGFCPGEAALPPGVAAAVSVHAHDGQAAAVAAAPSEHQNSQHGHKHGGGEDSSNASHHAPCLFAASATPAPTPTIAALHDTARQVAHFGRGNCVVLVLPTILRAQSPRGPPAFS